MRDILESFAIASLIMATVLWLVIGSCGCRTYYVYQYGTGDNEILVDAEVLKEINPQVEASLK